MEKFSKTYLLLSFYVFLSTRTTTYLIIIALRYCTQSYSIDYLCRCVVKYIADYGGEDKFIMRYCSNVSKKKKKKKKRKKTKKIKRPNVYRMISQTGAAPVARYISAVLLMSNLKRNANCKVFCKTLLARMRHNADAIYSYLLYLRHNSYYIHLS